MINDPTTAFQDSSETTNLAGSSATVQNNHHSEQPKSYFGASKLINGHNATSFLSR